MRILYVSKAMHVAAYRAKLRALAALVDVRAIIPERWGAHTVEPVDDDLDIELHEAVFHGHNHLHVYRHAQRLLAGPRPDVVHIDEEPYSLVTAQLVRLCRGHRVPCLFFAWQNLPKRPPPPFHALRAWVFRTADGAIAGTPAASDVLRNAGWARPLAVIPQMGVDHVHFAPDAAARARTRRHIGAEEDDFVIGFGGRLVREKGVHLLIEAAKGVPRSRVLLLGDGKERLRLRDAAQRAGIGQRVHFAGEIASLDMPAWLAALDVLALPSIGRPGWVEQFGRILIEAMSVGVPVVGSTSGEIPRVIGSAGLVVPAGDAMALREALLALHDSPVRRGTLAGLGRSRVLAEFTNDRIAADTVAFYRMLVAEPKPAWTA
jgi:glycosyltransferase involved in cell wall biosynthesis